MIIRNPRDLGLLIKKYRKLRSWSQQELADRIGASRYWVIDVEKGKPTAEIGLTLRALTALGLRVDIGDQLAVSAPTAVTPEPHGPSLADILSASTGATLRLARPASPRPADGERADRSAPASDDSAAGSE